MELKNSTQSEKQTEQSNCYKPTHGGARKGAGAKLKYNEPTTTISVRVPVSKVEEIKLTIIDMLMGFTTHRRPNNLRD